MTRRRLALSDTLLGLTVASALLVGAPGGTAWAADDDGVTLMRRVLQRTTWQDMQAKAVLTVVGRGGDARPTREIRVWSRKNAAGESRMVMLFDAPADFRGSGFLMVEHAERDDDRWLYSKGMRRLTRIQASGRGGNFMSSDFTYYDIGRPKLSDWTFKRQADATVDGVKCYVVAGTPSSPEVAEDTGYHRIVWRIEQKREVILGAEYFDKRLLADPKAPAFKRMRVEQIVELGGAPFASKMSVVDVQSGRTSSIHFDGLNINQGLEESFFSKRTLLRGR